MDKVPPNTAASHHRGLKKVFAGRFRAERRLRYDASGETLAGEDLQTGSPVLIRTVPLVRLRGPVHLRMEHEASILLHLRHPHMASLLATGNQDKVHYRVSEFVPGIQLAARLKQGPLSVSDCLRLGTQLMAALQAGHTHGVLHRGVRPSSILLDASQASASATLVDFGQLAHGDLEGEVRDRLLASARYMSPELAGLLDYGVEEAADLYSAGIVLYECLAGRPPFDAEEVGTLLRMHLTQTPADLRCAERQIPRVLEEVLQRLLRKDPRDRYQTAEAVGHDLECILRELEQGCQEPVLTVGGSDRRRTLTEPAFVGRESELAQLDKQLRRAAKGHGGLIVLEAESGVGKTRLLDGWAQRGRQAGAWVLRGHGRDQVGQQPFQLMDDIARDILSVAPDDDQLANRLQQHLGQWRDAASAALPQLAELLRGRVQAELGPKAFGRTRTNEALATLLDGLGTAARPALVLFDDCQWADEFTVEMLALWRQRLREASEQARHVVVVVAFRSEEVKETHALRRLRTANHIRLRPMSSDELQRLATSMAGNLPLEAVELIHRYSEGSPFMASAVLRGLVESGALVSSDAGWRMEPLAQDDIQSSRHAAAFLARRLRMLPPDVSRLLRVAAVLGKEFDVEMASELTGQDALETMTAAGVARRRHLLWEFPGHKWSFVHDRLRQALLDDLSADDRRQLHRCAADYLLRRSPSAHVDLAYHFDAAGDHERALPHALAAAEDARRRHALESAEQGFRIAARGAVGADPATQFRIAEGLGDVLMLQGRYDESEEQLLRAGELADTPLARAQIQGEVGELAFKRGDMRRACEAIEQGLRQLGEMVPGHWLTVIPLLAWETWVQVLHSLFPRQFLARRSLDGAERALQSTRLYSRLGYAYWFVRGWMASLWAHLRELNAAERYPPTRELAQAESAHAVAISLVPRYLKRGVDYAERSLEIRRQFEDTWGQGQSLHFYGAVLYAASQFEACIEKCRQAVRLLERTGDFWEVNIARFHIAASQYRLGNLGGAMVEAKAIHESGLQLHDEQASGISLDIWAKASRGRVPETALQKELGRARSDVQGVSQLLQARGVKLFYEGRLEDAATAFREAHARVNAVGIRNVWTAPILPWLATVLREQAVVCQHVTPARREALLREAQQVARQGLTIARNFRNDLPHALRELGLLAAMRGRVRQSRRLLGQSLREAEKQSAAYEAAQTRLALARLDSELPGEERQPQLVAAENALARFWAGTEGEALAVPTTLSLVDRFDSLLVAGRQVARGLSAESIFDAVREAADKLLRGEECRIVLLPPHTSFADLPAELRKSFSERIVRQVLESRRSVAFMEVTPDEAGDGMMLAGVRSALCAPILARDEVVALLLVTHRQIVGLFGKDEQRLADFITAIAGAALENAQGFAELRELARTLERRVADRTADAVQRAADLARSNEELEQFAYVASHDLQEPLRTIASYCQLVLRRYGDRLEDNGREFLEFAIDGARRMQGLIRDLLAYSRVSTQAKPMEKTDCNLLMERVLFNLQVAIREQEAVVTSDPLPTVLADATQLTQVFQNLVGNAIKFRAEAIPRIHVGASLEEDGWHISVRDNGIGMKPEHRERIFLIFQRLHTRDEYDGSGIGLSICKKTIERHGGRIWVEFKEGEGSTFCFTIPALDADGTTEDGDGNASSGGSENESSQDIGGSPNN